jgi:hypothetical protein
MNKPVFAHSAKRTQEDKIKFYKLHIINTDSTKTFLWPGSMVEMRQKPVIIPHTRMWRNSSLLHCTEAVRHERDISNAGR